jgi:cytidylate kinase
VEASEDAGRTLGERLLAGLERATPELAQASTAETFDEEVLRAVQAAVREYAAHDNVFIVGRGAGAILGAEPRVLRLFLHAPRAWRIEHVVQTMHTDAKTAEREVERIDKARSAYMRDWYGLQFGDLRNYDLCIDTSRFSERQASDLIVAAVRARSA